MKLPNAGHARIDRHKVTDYKEHERVVLTRGISEKELKAGDVGTVVHVHAGGRAFEVEFLTLSGDFVAVATVTPSQVRAIKKGEIAHARLLASV